jgi:hypothetical protein
VVPSAPDTAPPARNTTPATEQPATASTTLPAASTGNTTPAKTAAKPSTVKPMKEKPKSTSATVAVPPAAADASAASAPPAHPAADPSKPQLDFKAMEDRLRNTSAIGVFTKLSLKNQVDDLLKAFRGYHAGRIPPTLDDLQQRYDGLLLKVVSLLQNDDPELASSISASRSAIWQRLANRESFQAI